jgi:CRISPR-associated endonuclease/helicase Cas3
VDKRSGPVIARVLAYLIAGHHAGLDNWFGGLKERFAKDDTARELTDTLATELPESILHPPLPVPDDRDNTGRPYGWNSWPFRAVGAHAVFLPGRCGLSRYRSVHVAGRPRPPVSCHWTRWKCLRARLTAMTAQVAARGETDSQVNRKRAEVLRACLDKAELPPGVSA